MAVGKEMIKEHCFKQIVASGYHAASMRTIGEACGILKGSLYYYFPSKDAIVSELLKETEARFESFCFMPVENRNHNLESRLKQFFKGLEYLCFKEPYGRFILQLHQESTLKNTPLEAELQQFIKRWRKTIMILLEHNEEHKRSKRIATETIAKVFGLMMFHEQLDDKALKSLFKELKQRIDE